METLPNISTLHLLFFGGNGDRTQIACVAVLHVRGPRSSQVFFIMSQTIQIFLLGVRLIRLTVIIVYKLSILNKDSLHMFSKMLI